MSSPKPACFLFSLLAARFCRVSCGSLLPSTGTLSAGRPWMSAVFGSSQQDGCCFVSAPRTVNILGQTQLQVARWLTPDSWTSLQRPINVDINKESWKTERPLGSVPLSETPQRTQRSREIPEPDWRQRLPREGEWGPTWLQSQLWCCSAGWPSVNPTTCPGLSFLIWRNRKRLLWQATVRPTEILFEWADWLHRQQLEDKDYTWSVQTKWLIAWALETELPGLESSLYHSSASSWSDNLSSLSLPSLIYKNTNNHACCTSWLGGSNAHRLSLAQSPAHSQ